MFVFFGFCDREKLIWIDTDRFRQKISGNLKSGAVLVINLCFLGGARGAQKGHGPFKGP